MSVKVSVILPSLNVGRYIAGCLESVVSQSLREIEMICVDAGSTDGTLEILRRYEAADDRIRVICSDKKSYGRQMNMGMAAAKGEYVGIVETDDFILPGMYEELYRKAKDNDADFVKADFYRFTGEGENIRRALYRLSGKARYYDCIIAVEIPDALVPALHNPLSARRGSHFKNMSRRLSCRLQAENNSVPRRPFSLPEAAVLILIKGGTAYNSVIMYSHQIQTFRGLFSPDSKGMRLIRDSLKGPHHFRFQGFYDFPGRGLSMKGLRAHAHRHYRKFCLFNQIRPYQRPFITAPKDIGNRHYSRLIISAGQCRVAHPCLNIIIYLLSQRVYVNPVSGIFR